MKLQEQCVSLDLAKKMKELGFEQESMFKWHDCSDCYDCNEEDHTNHWEISLTKDIMVKGISAYTVAELGEMLPWDITIHRDINLGWHIVFQADGLTEKDMIFSEDISEADARAKMLCYLKENKLI